MERPVSKFQKYVKGGGAIVALLLLAFFAGAKLEGVSEAQKTPPLLADEQNTIALFQRLSPAVVFITNVALQQDFFSLDVAEIPRGSGSGFVWDSQGHIVTNFHVVEGAQVLNVTLNDHSSYRAKVVGVEPSKDIAVLKVDAPAAKLRPVVPGNSDDLAVGQKVIAIGNPFGLDQTLTTGVVSALGREIKSVNNRTIQNVVQTDAAINPGNSGGPLLDSRGNLIGVNTAIYSPSGSNAGIGFAVPVDTVKRVVPQLIQFGRVIRPGLGIEFLPEPVSARLGVKGIIIARVAPGSAAEKAGIRGLQRGNSGQPRLGDVIVGINGKRISDPDALMLTLEAFKVGDEVTVSLLREGKEVKVQARLQRLD